MDPSMRRVFRTARACDGHHVIARDHLRAGTVKARRPRVCAGGAKRSALHGAEHRCSIVVVMAVAFDRGNGGGWQINIASAAISWTISRKHLSGNAREDTSLVDRQFQEKQGEFVRENVDAIARNDGANTRRFSL